MARKPNVVPNVDDDMGFSDLAVTGSEIRTPNIDRLWRAPAPPAPPHGRRLTARDDSEPTFHHTTGARPSSVSNGIRQAQPPAMGTTWPVMKPHLSEAKNAMVSATSSGLPRRFAGMLASIFVMAFSLASNSGGK